MAPELMDPESHMTENRTFLKFLRENGAYDVETMRDLYAGGVRSMDGWLARLVARLERGDWAILWFRRRGLRRWDAR